MTFRLIQGFIHWDKINQSLSIGEYPKKSTPDVDMEEIIKIR